MLFKGKNEKYANARGCYVTGYLISKGYKIDKKVINDMYGLIKNAKKYKDYNGPLNDYERIGKDTRDELISLNDKEINNHVYKRILRIDDKVEQSCYSEALEDADLLVALINNDIRSINSIIIKRDNKVKVLRK